MWHVVSGFVRISRWNIYQVKKMYYFAYGLHLNKKEMLAVCPQSKPGFVVTLPNYKLVYIWGVREWLKKDASIRTFRGEKVLRAVYEVSDRHLGRLDNSQGLPGSATRLNVTLFNEDGEAVSSVTHIGMGSIEETKPSEQYLSLVQQGYRDWGLF